MLRWGQCFTRIALKCLRTVFPFLSSAPLNFSSFNKRSFCLSMFAAVGWQASEGTNLKTGVALLRLFSPAGYNLHRLDFPFTRSAQGCHPDRIRSAVFSFFKFSFLPSCQGNTKNPLVSFSSSPTCDDPQQQLHRNSSRRPFSVAPQAETK